MPDPAVDLSELIAFKIRCDRAAASVDDDLRRHVVDAAQLAARAARIAALGVTVRALPPGRVRRRGGRLSAHPPLAVTLAANISVNRTVKGAEIIQGHKGLTGQSAAALPVGIDAGIWRHPVYGGKRTVTEGGTPYFRRTINDHRLQMENKVEEVSDDIDRHLNRGI